MVTKTERGRRPGSIFVQIPSEGNLEDIISGIYETAYAQLTALETERDDPRRSWSSGLEGYLRSPFRYSAILRQAVTAGLMSGEKSERVGGRVTPELLAAAKAKSGIESQTKLLEYALSKVALEDDYGPKLLELKGSIPDDVEL